MDIPVYTPTLHQHCIQIHSTEYTATYVLRFPCCFLICRDFVNDDASPSQQRGSLLIAVNGLIHGFPFDQISTDSFIHA